MPRVVVLRWGHRPQRDARLTSHVMLAVRALGASGMILSDIEDDNIKRTADRITASWGGSFSLEMGTPWSKVVQDWKAQGGIVVHLTAYGENIETSSVLDKIIAKKKDTLVIVGSQKVPKEFYLEGVADFNVAVGNQPHSECASVAIFLDRFFDGAPLRRNFENARMKIIPQERGKKIVRKRRP